VTVLGGKLLITGRLKAKLAVSATSGNGNYSCTAVGTKEMRLSYSLLNVYTQYAGQQRLSVVE